MAYDNPSKKRQLFSVGKYEKEIINAFFLFACVPLGVSIGSLYWLYSIITDPASPHSIVVNKSSESLIILGIIALIYYFLFIGFLAYRRANKMVGSIPRVIKEIDDVLQKNKKTRIVVRQGDYLQELIDRINALIEKLQK